MLLAGISKQGSSRATRPLSQFQARYETETRSGVLHSEQQLGFTTRSGKLGNWEDYCVLLDMWHRDRRCKIGAAAVGVSKLPEATPHRTFHAIPNSQYPIPYSQPPDP